MLLAKIAEPVAQVVDLLLDTSKRTDAALLPVASKAAPTLRAARGPGGSVRHLGECFRIEVSDGASVLERSNALDALLAPDA
jgi:hypothetical protein